MPNNDFVGICKFHFFRNIFRGVFLSADLTFSLISCIRKTDKIRIVQNIANNAIFSKRLFKRGVHWSIRIKNKKYLSHGVQRGGRRK